MMFDGARGVIEILPGEHFYIDILGLSTKANSLSKYMIGTSAINALPQDISTRSDEPDTLDRLKLDNMTHGTERGGKK